MEFVPEAMPSADELPYDNPGYGEGEGGAEISRPGHVENKKGKLKLRAKKEKRKKVKSEPGERSPFLTNRNLRVAGLAVVLAATGYLGLKGFIGNGDSPDQIPANPMSTELQAQSSVPMAPAPIIMEMEPTTPVDIGGVPLTAGPKVTSQAGATQTLEQAANSGNAIAQFQLGITYLDAGQTEKGIDLIRASAAQGQPAAQYRLAKLYERGIGVTTDLNQSKDLMERAALAGNRVAMHDLGLYFALGMGGTEIDMRQSLNWFEKAAERGVVDSQFNLGRLYSANEGIPLDLPTAYVWFSIASRQGDQFASQELESIKAKMSPEALAQADRRVTQFTPTDINKEANGIFLNVPWTMPDKDDIQISAELVRDAQSLLGQLGYDVGAPDGDAGPKTRNAVKAFERANGLPETGQISASLVDRLEAAAGV